MGVNDNFVVGDKVLRINIREEQRKGGKMEAEWLGPYVISNIEGKSVDLTNPKGTTMSKISIDHLKQYVEPEERIPPPGRRNQDARYAHISAILKG